MGSVERVLVLGIVVVIVAILGIAVWGATGDEEPALANGGVDGGPGNVDDSAAPGNANKPFSIAEEIARLRNKNLGTQSPASKTTPKAKQPKTGNEPPGVALKPPAPFTPQSNPQSNPPAPKPKAAAPALYEVASGDSLWKIAHRHYGDGDVQKHIDLILGANPSIDVDDVLNIGTRLTLPPVANTDVSRMPPVEQVKALDGTLYEVREGDSLSSIAQQQLGSAARWQEIYDLNRERIQDPGNIFVGATLRLPKS